MDPVRRGSTAIVAFGHVRRRQFHVGIDFGQAKRDIDLRHFQDIVFGQGAGDPFVAAPGQDRRGDAALFDDDITPDRRGRLIFAELDDAVGMRGAGAHHLEHDPRVADDGLAPPDGAAIDKGIGMANSAGDLDLQSRPAHTTRLAQQSLTRQRPRRATDRLMGIAAARHRKRLDTIEFIARLLKFLPGEEFQDRHRSSLRDARGAYHSALGKPIETARYREEWVGDDLKGVKALQPRSRRHFIKPSNFRHRASSRCRVDPCIEPHRPAYSSNGRES
jgi:hypothetical protein